MSKTYNSDLQSNNERIQVLINKANSLPEAGGSSVDTCTVTLDNENMSNDCRIISLVATILKNGVPTTYYDYIDTKNSSYIYSKTISNVICGTKIYLRAYLYHVETSGVFVDIQGSAIHNDTIITGGYDEAVLEFIAPTVANENCIIYYTYDA